MEALNSLFDQIRTRFDVFQEGPVKALQRYWRLTKWPRDEASEIISTE
jgi:hypothetical protein